ncbi:MAG: fibronectin type III domain-containing protein [Ferruginibacter sp.]
MVADPTGVGSAGFTANWTAPNGGSALTISYTIQLSTSSSFSSPTSNSGISTLFKTYTGLLPVTKYYYRVEAITTSGTSVMVKD